MKEIVKMSVDVELGYIAFDEQDILTKELIEKEKYAYSDGVKDYLLGV